MIDLQRRFSELDHLEAPDMRSDIERRVTELLSEPRKSLTTPDRPPFRWRGPLIALGTAVAILVIVGAAVLMLRTDPSEVTDTTVAPTPTTLTPPETTTPPATTTVPPTSTTIPQPATPIRIAGTAEDAGWTLIKKPFGAFRIGPRRLANGLWASLDIGWRRTGLMAPGGVLPDPMRDITEVLWTSVDGVEWESKEVPEFTGRAVYTVKYGSYPYPPGADGQLWAIVQPIDEQAPSELWITDDAETWHQAQWNNSEPVVPDTWTPIQGVSRVDDVILMTSYRVASGGMQHVSTDRGRTFTQISPYPQDGYATLHWATDHEIRTFVKTATEEINLWRTTDGLRWDRLGEVTGLPEYFAELLDPAYPEVVVSWSPTALLVSWARDWRCDDTVAVSSDGGLNWDLVDVYGEMSVGGSQADCNAASIRGGWLRVVKIDVDTGNSVLWVSQNGTDWYSIDDWVLDEQSGMIEVSYGYLVPPDE